MGPFPSPKPTFFQLTTPFPRSAAPGLLSRFVSDRLRPMDNFAPRSPPVKLLGPDPEIFYSVVGDSFKHFLDVNKSHYRNLPVLGASSQAGGQHDLTAAKVITYGLKQHNDMFEELLADDNVKKELLKLMSGNGGKAYMVVGFKTCINASIGREMTVKRTMTGTVELSPTAVLPVNDGPVLAAGATNIQNTKFSQSQNVGKDGEEIVFAVEYKLVRKRIQFQRPHVRGIRLGRRVGEVSAWGTGYYGDSDEEDVDLEMVDIEETEGLLF